jgi:hypothetical protein
VVIPLEARASAIEAVGTNVPAGWTPTMKMAVVTSGPAALHDAPPFEEVSASKPAGTAGSAGLDQYVAKLTLELFWDEKTIQYFVLA